MGDGVSSHLVVVVVVDSSSELYNESIHPDEDID